MEHPTARTIVTDHDLVTDVIEPPGDPAGVAILWHGWGTHERLRVRRLGMELARRGRVVVVPDHGAELPDGGKSAMLESYRYVTEELDQDHEPELWGWSYGAACALAFAFEEMPHLSCLVGLAGGYHRRTPFDRRQVMDLVRPVTHPVYLVHGTDDTVTLVNNTEEMASKLYGHGVGGRAWFPVIDHAGVVLGEFDESLDMVTPVTAELNGHPMVPILDEICG